MKQNLAVLLIAFGSAAISLSFGSKPQSNGDTSPLEGWVSGMVAIKYEKASDIAAALNRLTTHYHGLGTNSLAAKPGAEQIFSNAWANVSQQYKEANELKQTVTGCGSNGNGLILANERNNSVLMYASKSDLTILKETIARLDTTRDQVLIESVIFEIPLSGTNRVETICFGNTAWEGRGLTTNGPSGYFQEFAPIGGTNDDLNSTVKRLAALGEVRIIQRPSFQTSDGEAASLFIAASGNVFRTAQNAPGMHPEERYHSISELLLGTTLDITPTITPEKNLVMNIAQTIETYEGSTNISNVGEVPVTRRRSTQTEVTVADRQTFVLAGPVEQTQDKPSKGIPVLKNTPLIGGLFRNHPHQTQVETVLAVRATILPQDHAQASQEGAVRAFTTNR